MLSFHLYFCCSLILASVAQSKQCARTSHWRETQRHGSIVILQLDKRLTGRRERVCLHFLPVRNASAKAKDSSDTPRQTRLIVIEDWIMSNEDISSPSRPGKTQREKDAISFLIFSPFRLVEYARPWANQIEYSSALKEVISMCKERWFAARLAFENWGRKAHGYPGVCRESLPCCLKLTERSLSLYLQV